VTPATLAALEALDLLVEMDLLEDLDSKVGKVSAAYREKLE